MVVIYLCRVGVVRGGKCGGCRKIRFTRVPCLSMVCVCVCEIGRWSKSVCVAEVSLCNDVRECEALGDGV